jgi:hypothetical protein
MDRRGVVLTPDLKPIRGRSVEPLSCSSGSATEASPADAASAARPRQEALAPLRKSCHPIHCHAGWVEHPQTGEQQREAQKCRAALFLESAKVFSLSFDVTDRCRKGLALFRKLGFAEPKLF